MKVRRALKWAGAGLVLVMAIAYATLVASKATTPASCAWTLDMNAVRSAASAISGPKATEIRVERIVSFAFPQAMVCAGRSWGNVDMKVFAYQLVFPTQTVILDMGMTEGQAHASLGEDVIYDRFAWSHLEASAAKASAIYVTHEHADHLGGLLALAPDVIERAGRVSREQMEHLTLLGLPVSDAARAALKPQAFESIQPVAPGLVLIKAAGHTPGSLMIYVQLDDGRELILTGDTAWQQMNIDDEQGPPRLTSLMLHNDRDANQCQLAALHRVSQTDSTVTIIPGHDAAKVDALVRTGTLTLGFRE